MLHHRDHELVGQLNIFRATLSRLILGPRIGMFGFSSFRQCALAFGGTNMRSILQNRGGRRGTQENPRTNTDAKANQAQ